MKVVLFCGGMGMRIRDYSGQIPKPLAEVGSRPILWHLMKYYAHYGHKDFILCLGHGAQEIKNYFLKYDECATNDYRLTEGGRKVDLLSRDIDDWRITFVDTGLKSNIGERLRRVRSYVGDDEMFLANYADGLSDLDLEKYIEQFRSRNKVATFLSVPAPHTFHIVHADEREHVVKLEHVTTSPVRINGGFFVLRREIFDVMKPGEELVIEPFNRLIERKELLAVAHGGFWQNMDTFKDKIQLDEILAQGHAPWEVWKTR
ncbi:MAG: sugar phosphate nucleotidyltransferase [Polyangiaceae bacterium]